MKKISLLLCILFLLSVFCTVASANDYGSDTKKLLITHINEGYSGHEGTGIIYTTSSDGTLSPFGSFDWWNVVAFEWSDDDNCFVVKSIDTKMGSTKASVVIPENGFVYCCNVGNDYPSLGDSTKPDYTTDAMDATCAYVQTLKTGDKAYLYGVDILNATVDTNSAEWYTDDFSSNSFIKIGDEENGLIAYNPESAVVKVPDIKLGINAINSGVEEGQSMLLTPSFGATITENGNNYGWCRVAVFDWSEEDNAYVLISVDTSVGNGVEKNALIPPNGFAVSVNTGNNYPALGYPSKPNYVNATATNVYEKIATLSIGTKVYLEGIDLANSKFEYSGDITKYYSSEFTTNAFITVSDTKPGECYEPDTSKILDPTEIKNTDNIYTISDINIEWNTVEGASEYYVAVLNSTVNTNGAKLLSKKTSETSVTIPADQLNIGSKYTVNIYAISENSASEMTVYSFTVCSERALNSVFLDKTVVAFGDSITAWKGWVSMLYGELGTEVINAGVGGDRTVQALARIDNDVIAHNPDLVIVNFGMNDQAVDESTGKNLTPIEEYETNYRTIIEKIRDTGSDIILVAVHDVCDSKYGGGAPAYNKTDANGVGYVDRYNEVVKKLADEYNLGFLDINSLAADQLDSIILDGIHLNDAGQVKYSEWISDYCFEYMENKPDSNGEASAENSENTNEMPEPNEEVSDSIAASGTMPTLQIAIIACIMFVGISIIGVMFIKIVKKNK